MAAAVQSSAVSILRILRQFFETDLCGACRWDKVLIVRDTDQIVEVSFAVEKGRYRIIVNPPGDDPRYPLGRILLMGTPAQVEGPLDSAIWARVAKEIRAHAPTVEHELAWE